METPMMPDTTTPMPLPQIETLPEAPDGDVNFARTHAGPFSMTRWNVSGARSVDVHVRGTNAVSTVSKMRSTGQVLVTLEAEGPGDGGVAGSTYLRMTPAEARVLRDELTAALGE